MSKPRKVRRDSKLKNLPAEQRELIANWLTEDGVDSCLQSMRSQLGISSNRDSVYQALAFWRAEKRFGSFQTIAQAQAEMEAAAKGGMTADQMQEAVDRNFIMLAANEEDTKLYQEMRYLRLADQTAKSNAKIALAKLRQKDAQIVQKEKDLQLTERRVKLLEDREKKTREVMGDTALSPEEKEKRIKAVFGISA